MSSENNSSGGNSNQRTNERNNTSGGQYPQVRVSTVLNWDGSRLNPTDDEHDHYIQPADFSRQVQFGLARDRPGIAADFDVDDVDDDDDDEEDEEDIEDDEGDEDNGIIGDDFRLHEEIDGVQDDDDDEEDDDDDHDDDDDDDDADEEEDDEDDEEEDPHHPLHFAILNGVGDEHEYDDLQLDSFINGIGRASRAVVDMRGLLSTSAGFPGRIHRTGIGNMRASFLLNDDVIELSSAFGHGLEPFTRNHDMALQGAMHRFAGTEDAAFDTLETDHPITAIPRGQPTLEALRTLPGINSTPVDGSQDATNRYEFFSSDVHPMLTRRNNAEHDEPLQMARFQSPEDASGSNADDMIMSGDSTANVQRTSRYISAFNGDFRGNEGVRSRNSSLSLAQNVSFHSQFYLSRMIQRSRMIPAQVDRRWSYNPSIPEAVHPSRYENESSSSGEPPLINLAPNSNLNPEEQRKIFNKVTRTITVMLENISNIRSLAELQKKQEEENAKSQEHKIGDFMAENEDGAGPSIVGSNELQETRNENQEQAEIVNPFHVVEPMEAQISNPCVESGPLLSSNNAIPSASACTPSMNVSVTETAAIIGSHQDNSQADQQHTENNVSETLPTGIQLPTPAIGQSTGDSDSMMDAAESNVESAGMESHQRNESSSQPNEVNNTAEGAQLSDRLTVEENVRLDSMFDAADTTSTGRISSTRPSVSMDQPATTDQAVIEAATRSTGIDPTFLAALPEEMRAEVLAAHIEQLTTYSSTEGESTGGHINEEFLAALPPEIRSEVMEQENALNAQRESERNRAEQAPEDIDSAIFLASLPPELREDILLTADDQFVANLPPHLSAEARVLRDRFMQSRGPFGDAFRRIGNTEAPTNPEANRESSIRRAEMNFEWICRDDEWHRNPIAKDAKLFLSEKALEMIVNIVYLQDSLRKNSLFRVMTLLCRNSIARSKIIKLLMDILIKEISLEDTYLPGKSKKQIDHYGLFARPLIIRKVLELLTNISKNDQKVAEDLSIPFIGDDVHTKAEHKFKPDNSGRSPIQTLLASLSNQYFTRGTVFLDLIIHIVASACANFPSAVISRLNPDGTLIKRDKPDDVAGPSGVNNCGAKNETENKDHEALDHGKKEDGDKKEEKLKSVRYIPDIPKENLSNLIGVLLRQGFADRTYQRITTIINQLSKSDVNRAVFTEELSKCVVNLGVSIASSFEDFLVQIDSVNDEERAQHISEFASGSNPNELKILRLQKSILSITESFPVVNSISLEELVPLWTSLDRVMMKTCSDNANVIKKLDNSKSPAGDGASTINGNDLSRPRVHGGPLDFGKHHLPPILVRLSPIIETYFIANSIFKSQEKSKKSTEQAKGEKEIEAEKQESEEPAHIVKESLHGIDSFLEHHKIEMNAILRSNPSLLETSFHSALSHPQFIDFDNKKNYFKRAIRRRGNEVRYGAIRVHVRREQVFEDSYHQLRLRTPEEMKGRLHVQFIGEEGVDAGGVTREWYSILARKIFDANYALFIQSAAKTATYQPNPLSYINEDHLGFFKFVGRIIGKAIYDGQLLDAYFTRSFYKHILGIKPNYHDFEQIDPDYYKSLCWILENSITGILDLTMSTEYDHFGKEQIIDLIPNGRNIPVTDENKQEYIKHMCDVKLSKSIQHQIKSFLEGFHELITPKSLKIFNELELELLMSGLPDIDIADLKANIEYSGYTISSPQITWFWKFVSTLGQEDLARLIMFVTGTSKVPLEGFGALQGMNGLQKFHIHRVGDSNRLPSAHTCFNQLDLPEYSSYERLSERLMTAMHEGGEGFGFA